MSVGRDHAKDQVKTNSSKFLHGKSSLPSGQYASTPWQKRILQRKAVTAVFLFILTSE